VIRDEVLCNDPIRAENIDRTLPCYEVSIDDITKRDIVSYRSS